MLQWLNFKKGLKMNTCDNIHARPKALSGNQYWPEILIAQHKQIKREISRLRILLQQVEPCYFQLSSLLKKITKALKMHLQLEANFLTPYLALTAVTSNHRIRLNEGFDALRKATFEVLSVMRALVNQPEYNPNHKHSIQAIEHYLLEVELRLSDEDLVYSVNLQR